jgi:hypothetical protein
MAVVLDVAERSALEVIPRVRLTVSRMASGDAETVSISDPNPDFCATIRYFPGLTSENKNAPSLSVLAETLVEFPLSSSDTDAWGTGFLAESSTTPAIVIPFAEGAGASCANKLGARKALDAIAKAATS